MAQSSKTIKPASTNKNKLSRREFISSAAAAAATFTIVPRSVLGGPGNTPPSEKLNIAAIGCGGQGWSDLRNVSSENIVALCDVDDRWAKPAWEKFPNAKRYKDFRVMLDKQKDIDAVTVSTPDHTHAVASMTAIKHGKHVYVQKPMAHSIYEVRMLTEAARKYKVATQMGIQGHAFEGPRLLCEWIWDGAIGPVREVHVWSNRPADVWAQGRMPFFEMDKANRPPDADVWAHAIPRPKENPPVPSELDWDLWLGPAPSRPYHPCYAPWRWRGWWDFGTGALGDMGCHDISPIFWALKLGHPTSVEASSTQVFKETFPWACKIHYQFPARGDMPPLKMVWYDGGLLPDRPEELEDDRQMPLEDGIIFVGDKGKILAEGWGAQSPRLIPEAKMKEYNKPPKTIPRGIQHHQDWIRACKGGPAPLANFDYSGPLAEIVLLGNVAVRIGEGKKLYWDGPNMKVTNIPEANEYIRREYRQGWTL